jgi:hypothetical protein
MSKQYPECPLFNHENCKECYNLKVCAIVRKEKVCLRNIPKTKNKARKRKGSKGTDKRDNVCTDKPVKEITHGTQKFLRRLPKKEYDLSARKG